MHYSRFTFFFKLNKLIIPNSVLFGRTEMIFIASALSASVERRFRKWLSAKLFSKNIGGQEAFCERLRDGFCNVLWTFQTKWSQ